MFELIRANKRRTVLLMAGFVLVVTLVALTVGSLTAITSRRSAAFVPPACVSPNPGSRSWRC